MQRTQLVVENVCPQCGSSACAQFLSVDGREVHINCLDCNRVYAGRVPSTPKTEVRRWREIGSFVRL